jgi:hypothetical protein
MQVGISIPSARANADENMMMKLKLMLNKVFPARTNARICNLLKLVCQAQLA